MHHPSFGLRDNIPEWHNPRSREMRLEKADSSHVSISGPTSRLIIVELLDLLGAEVTSKWIVRRELYSEEEWLTRDEITMDARQLCDAFGLNDKPEYEDQWGDTAYEHTAFEAGRYFRYDQYLNIPNPGTGEDGDPNISILITDDMKHAIAAMVLEGLEQNFCQLSFGF